MEVEAKAPIYITCLVWRLPGILLLLLTCLACGRVEGCWQGGSKGLGGEGGGGGGEGGVWVV